MLKRAVSECSQQREHRVFVRRNGHLNAKVMFSQACECCCNLLHEVAAKDLREQGRQPQSRYEQQRQVRTRRAVSQTVDLIGLTDDHEKGPQSASGRRR